MNEVFKALISDFHNRSLPHAHSRGLVVPINSGKIISVIGVRRCGKTFLFYHLIKELLASIDLEPPYQRRSMSLGHLAWVDRGYPPLG